jgi:hypothetical protein
MTSLRRGATAAYRWLTIVFFVGVVVQFFLAGLGVFGIEPGVGLSDSSLEPHRVLGVILEGFALLLLALVLIARPTRHVAVPYIVLFALTSVLQPAFAMSDNEILGGLHGLTAIAIFGLAGWLGHRSFRREVTAP